MLCLQKRYDTWAPIGWVICVFASSAGTLSQKKGSQWVKCKCWWDLSISIFSEISDHASLFTTLAVFFETTVYESNTLSCLHTRLVKRGKTYLQNLFLRTVSPWNSTRAPYDISIHIHLIEAELIEAFSLLFIESETDFKDQIYFSGSNLSPLKVRFWDNRWIWIGLTESMR